MTFSGKEQEMETYIDKRNKRILPNNIISHSNHNIYIVYEYLGQPSIEIQGTKLGLQNFVTGPTEKGFVLGDFEIIA